MRYYTFTEQPYADAWTAKTDSLRVSFPNSYCDPERAADYLHQHIDEWQLADELGLNIFVNEHHSTATCLSASCTIILAILARVTKKARLLALGMPIGHRSDIIRTAEEFAMIDVISRGRLEMGLVKGVPPELVPSNTNPALLSERFWEGHDLLLKALTTHDAPFSWEGKHFQYRNVNVWPRPYQQPHPPVWITATSPSSIAPIAQRGYVLGTVLSGYNAKGLYDLYRSAWYGGRRSGEFPLDRLCYTGFVSVASTETEARERAVRCGEYLKTNALLREPYLTPDGLAAPSIFAKMFAKNGSLASPHQLANKQGVPLGGFATASVQNLIDGGVMFAGTPDQVYDQIVDFYDYVGGFGHFNIVTHSGNMPFADVADTMTLFAKEVVPKLEEHIASQIREAA